MTQLGDTVFVSYETSRKLRKEGWRPTNDVVVMTYVGKPDPKVPSNRQRANRCAWSFLRENVNQVTSIDRPADGNIRA